MATPTVINIASRGDVILICSDGKQPIKKTHLRVSSHVLQLGSSVFSVMLGPDFKEGKALAAKGTVEIDLPDDDPQAMTTMCKIMHISPDVMGTEPTAARLACLAVHADKYNTVCALGMATYYWLNKSLAKDLPDTRAMLLGVAYAFDHAELFERAGKAIVMGCIAPTKLAIDNCPETLPSTLLKLQELRGQILEQFGNFVDKHMSSEIGEGAVGSFRPTCCDVQMKRVMVLMRDLKHSRLWPLSVLRGRSLVNISREVKKIKMLAAADIKACRSNTCETSNLKDGPTISQMLRDEVGTWESTLQVCLKCAKGGYQTFGKTCRHR